VTARRVDRIVTALDGSDFSRLAVPAAARLAKKLGAARLLFSAVATVDEEAERRAWLESVTATGTRVRREVAVSTDPAGAIHEVLRREGLAVPCIATHARVRATLTRSVLTELLVRAHDPVLAIGPGIDCVPPALEHVEPRGVVVGVDDNDESIPLVEVATDWAGQAAEPVTVLTVAEPVPPPLVAGPVRRRWGPDDDVDLFLRALLARVRRDGVEIGSQAVYDPIGPADGLVAYVREHPSSSLVVGTAAPKGLERLAKGSTAAAIVRSSAAPVLVVPTRVRSSTTSARRRPRATSAPVR
jgi:nucleotide-binding universal stress UspA family protein